MSHLTLLYLTLILPNVLPYLTSYLTYVLPYLTFYLTIPYLTFYLTIPYLTSYLTLLYCTIPYPTSYLTLLYLLCIASVHWIARPLGEERGVWLCKVRRQKSSIDWRRRERRGPFFICYCPIMYYCNFYRMFNPAVLSKFEALQVWLCHYGRKLFSK